MSIVRNKLLWYRNRLRCMSAAERLYRAWKGIVIQFEKLTYRFFFVVREPVWDGKDSKWLFCSDGINQEPYIRGANKIIGGVIDILQKNDIPWPTKPSWNRNPLSGHDAPMYYGKTLDYRNQRLVGDIKYLWVPNRHAHLVAVAQAYHVTGDDKYLSYINIQLKSWFKQCPHLRGPNWVSSLELAIRLINWALIWRLIGGYESRMFNQSRGHEFRQEWLQIIFRHIRFIRGHLSKYSSANNHLIGELAGVFVACLVWPYWKMMRRWAMDAQVQLTQQVNLQTAPDGVHREQAIFYQQFVLDFLNVAGLIAESSGMGFSQGYWARIEAMIEYLASVIDVAGNTPMIGDSDNGYFLKLSHETDFSFQRSLLALGAVLFDRADFARKAHKIDDKARWFLGGDADRLFSRLLKLDEGVLPVRTAFRQGGYYILGDDFETDKEVRIIIDCGPLGYPDMAAHGHSDALALCCFSIGGREILVDVGTFAYQTDEIWRSYFRGTSAHNTVRVDRQDQSIIGGKFMWLTHANSECEKWREDGKSVVFSGSHDGYLRLRDPLRHRRNVAFDGVKQSVLIRDEFECEGRHLIERFWHFSEKCQVELEGRDVVASNRGVCARFEMIGRDPVVQVRYGSQDPIGGWISRGFGEKYPTTTVVVQDEILGHTELVTRVSYSF